MYWLDNKVASHAALADLGSSIRSMIYDGEAALRVAEYVFVAPYIQRIELDSIDREQHNVHNGK